MTNTKTIKTTLHHYCFDINNKEGAAKWKQLKEDLQFMLPRQMHSHSGGYQPITCNNSSEDIILETSCLFNNQWNEAATETRKGRRLFDWYLEYRLTGKHIKQGHWIEQNQEMQDIRDNTKKCGYCGNMTVEDLEFCPKCIGSEYLDKESLRLTRFRPISKRDSRYPELTEEELATLLPLYEVAQGLGKEKREEQALSKARIKVANLVPEAERKAAGLVIKAQKETEAYTWLLDNKYRELNNVIYYDHKDTFSFGWSKPLSAQEKSRLETLLTEFPFDWEFSKNY
jgi:hypothetical protein